jgi:adenylosuccinate lyase
MEIDLVMSEDELLCISPLDGRYSNKTNSLKEHFSEYALIKQRVMVEVEYFIALGDLAKLPALEKISFDAAAKESVRNIYRNFSIDCAKTIKEIEKETNHDVKAVEYFLREKFDFLGLGEYKEYIHFGLTSQDINNTAIPLMIKGGMEEVVYPILRDLTACLNNMAVMWMDVPMLSKTHGQPATPTTVGRQIMVFVERLEKQLNALEQYRYYGKFGGATGGLNAHYVTFPDIDWDGFADKFLEERLEGLERNHYTTQIDHYDDLSVLFDNLRRINVILLDLSKDFWQYISLGYFTQKTKDGEVGSSAMPHKVNPIDFENAEGNLGLANCLLDHFSNKLPVSRLQRDLTDSTVFRNLGVPFGHSLVAYTSILSGLAKIEINMTKLEQDLEENWIVVTEAYQCILRAEGYPHPYEKLKEFSRGKPELSKVELLEFIESLDVSEQVKVRLRQVSPMNYLGNYLGK